MKKQSILIYDIETATFGNAPNPEKDVFKIFGCYSYLTHKYYYLTKISQIKEILKYHKYIIGFNNLQYDNVVLYFNGMDDHIKVDDYGSASINKKINIDLMDIFKKRAKSMKIKEGLLDDLLMRYSLDYISKTIGIVNNDTGKIDNFDYSILNKTILTEKEEKEIISYLQRDLDVTKKMYEWLEDYFNGFKDFITSTDIKNKTYLTSTIGVFAYKAICKYLNINEEYSDNKTNKSFGGGYVSYPAGESFEGNIYCIDYNSLYPHIFSQCNLFSPAELGWNGGKLFKTKGIYNDKEMGQIENLLMSFYKLRKEYKKINDPREYSVKIIINTAYGLTGSPTFKHLYNPVGAADCTHLGRQWTMLARKKFRDSGYEILYTDTDSWYIRDPFDNKDKILETKDDLIKEIKSSVPFPVDSFDAGIDDEISHMWFFKSSSTIKKEETLFMDEDDHINKEKGFMKKNYIYLTKDNKIVYKNLGVKKKSTSTLTRYIFKEILIPKIKEEKKVKWDKNWFVKTINELLDKDLMLVATRYQVKAVHEYKNSSQLQCQISERYGPGIHFLIKNDKYGIGKASKYCTIDEFKKMNMSIDDIDLSSVWKELEYFIDLKTLENNSVSLSEWGF